MSQLVAAIVLLSACRVPATPTTHADSQSVELQEISIPTRYGHTLEGRYYLAKTDAAPIIVFMHWSGGSLEDWDAIARWLQNRDVPSSEGEDKPWTNSEWFPELDEDISFAILSFNYWPLAGSGGSETHLRDSLDVLAFASTLEGIDPSRIIAAGASIGADGAIDACYLFNQAVLAGKAAGNCAGAFSLSPANYLTDAFPYHEAASALVHQGAVVYCLAATKDAEASSACKEMAESENFRAFIFDGYAHGMSLIDPALFPSDPQIEKNSLQILLEFLEKVTGNSLIN